MTNTEAGQTEAVARAPRERPGVAAAAVVTSVVGEVVTAIGCRVLNPIHGIVGLRNSKPLLVVG